MLFLMGKPVMQNRPRGKRIRRVVLGVSLVAMLAAAGLWESSGRERLTKNGKSVNVTVKDDVFGDSVERTEFKPGPILGWYIGLDAVAITTGAACLATIVTLIATRNRGQQVALPENQNA